VKSSNTGLSPVITIMLLALISIILSVIMYATFLPSLTRLIGQFTYKAGVERISLDSARLKEDSSLIIVITEYWRGKMCNRYHLLI